MVQGGAFVALLERARAAPREWVEDEPTIVIETAPPADPPARPTRDEEVPTRLALDTVFKHPGAHPLVLDLLLLQKHGIEWLGWELETLIRRIAEDFGSEPSELNLEKLQACRALHLVDTFWQRWECFVPCCLALNGFFADFDILHAPTVAECMIAVDIAERIRSDLTWSDELKRFLEVVHRHDQVLCPQPPLDFVRIDTEGFPLDCARVRALFAEARRLGRPPSSNTAEDEQVRRMLEARVVLESSRASLQDQLALLRHG